MKFGKQIKRLADPTHLNHCIAYDVLKKAINVVVADESKLPEGGEVPDIGDDLKEVNEAFGQSTGALSGSARPPDSRFHGLLQHELAKVNRFANLLLRTLLDTLREAQRLASKPGALNEEGLSSMERSLDTAAEQLVQLEHFRRLNFTGFRKIVKKFDKRSSRAGTGSLASWFLPALLREFFVAEPLDSHLLALAWGYAALRRYRRGSGAATAPTPPVNGNGAAAAAAAAPVSTSTFWLMPPARMRALCTLIKRFELMSPMSGSAMENAASSSSPSAYVEQMRRLLLSMAPDGPARGSCRLRAHCSLVYCDSPDFGEYVGRIRNPEGSCGFRCRQTLEGGQVAGSTNSGLVERDGSCSALGAHAFTPVSQLSSPDAFPIPQQGSASMQSLLAVAARDAVSTEEAAGLSSTARVSLQAFANQVQDVTSKASLAPVAVVSSSRVLLRGDTPATEGVSIALDEDVQFSRFPYCLLEVASGEGASGPWLEELWSYAALRTVQGFSVGEHLHTMESSAPPEAWGLMLEWRAAVNEEAQEGADAGSTAASKVVALAPPATQPKGAAPVVHTAGEPAPPAGVSVPLEPKNFMASERTMLEWIHTVIALAFLGIGLWKYSLSLKGEDAVPRPMAMGLLNAATFSSLVLGCYSLVLVAIAVCFAWYAVLSHNARLSALFANKHTEGVFNRRLGPDFAGAIGVALFSHLVVQVVPLWLALGSDDSISGMGGLPASSRT
eukprot:CAMPEP_0115746574 /NCGR_PEP_ID=MMETSP0272-20121206/92710_1 /TAXON_ID=71861 /ORGANISM="Scrippsiella trochoidea, Strain CCMP3099" /LENGTH=727 /DNA_ID=CAMNT_0003191525 /DNA_START=62 /DNA_END=2248 /DNA_ORIENTATION=+